MCAAPASKNLRSRLELRIWMLNLGRNADRFTVMFNLYNIFYQIFPNKKLETQNQPQKHSID